MGGIQQPKPCFLDSMEYYGVREGKKVWRSPDNERYYTWDSLHGEIEVFNKRGWHLGTVDAKKGKNQKDAVKGRRLRL